MSAQQQSKGVAPVAYAITSGEYSSYTVCAIFTDKALFDGYVEMCRAAGEEPDTEELLLNPCAEEIRNRVPYWRVEMGWDGDDAKAEQFGPVFFAGGEAEWHPALPHRSGEVGKFTVWLSVKDAQTAIKAANERRIQARATGMPRDFDEYFAWLKTQEL